MTDYFYGEAPRVGTQFDAVEDVRKNTEMLLPILQKMDEDREAAKAANSPFVRQVTQALMEPVVPNTVNPSFNDLTPGAVGSYKGLNDALRGGGGPPLDVLGRAAVAKQLGGAPAVAMPQAGMGYEPLPGDTLAALRAAGVDPMSVGDTVTARHPFVPRMGLPGQMPPPMPVGPRSAYEMNFFTRNAPYLAQRRVAQEQFRTGTTRDTIKGEYGEKRAELKAGVELNKAMLAAEARVRAALRAKPGSEPWKQVKAGMDTMRQVYTSQQATLGKWHDSGFDIKEPGTPERDKYDQLFNESQAFADRLKDYEDRFTSMTEQRVGKIRGRGGSATGLSGSSGGGKQSVPDYMTPLP